MRKLKSKFFWRCFFSWKLLVLAVTSFEFSIRAASTPSIVSPKDAEKLVKQLPNYTTVEYSGLAFYDKKLHASSNIGLLEFESGSLKQLYQWNKFDSVVEGPWLDSANKLLWVWLASGDELANYDGKRWKTMRMPEPQKGLSRGNILEGFRGICNSQTFWIEGAWHAWAWDAKRSVWNVETNPPVLAELNHRQVLNRLIPTDEHVLFIMHRDIELMYSDIELQQKQKGDAIYYFDSKWNEVSNKSHFVFFADQTLSAGKAGYVRTTRGDMLRVADSGIQKLQTPGKCEAAAVTSSGTLLACIQNLGVFEFKNEWELRFKTPYPSTEGKHWVHLAENDGQIALAVSPMPQLVGDKTVFNSSAALWLFDAQGVRKMAFPK